MNESGASFSRAATHMRIAVSNAKAQRRRDAKPNAAAILLLRFAPLRLWAFALIPTLALGLAFNTRAADLVPVAELGLRVERGFAVTLFADNDLAPDTWCMTIDSLGRVVVANGQSIRTLADDDGDGAADRAIEFTRVERGVMGMCFDGTSLYVAADGWF